METTAFVNNTAADDQKLMEGLQKRQPEALQSLYQRYGAMLKSIVMQFLYDDADAEDVLQEIFLQVWDRAANYSFRAF